jgi:hypothetical protein
MSGNLAARDFSSAPTIPISSATNASAIHTDSHRVLTVCREATHAAATAVDPINMPPTPGTAVKDPARSMVSRMYRKLSMACVWMATGSGRGLPIAPSIRHRTAGFKYFVS